MPSETPAGYPYPPRGPVLGDPFGEQSLRRLYAPAPGRLRFQHRLGRHIFLLLATMLTTTLAGGCHYANFASDFGRRAVTLDLPGFLLSGVWYSATLLLILGAHEMGHYLLCRRYNVDATLPFFLPAPLMTGTLGAVIRIREAFPTRAALFDIGVAGPIAGFVVLVPALFIGLVLSRITLAPPPSDSLVNLGEPLLFQLGTWLVHGTVPEGHAINMHPMVFAAWFGMLATALNLLPFGQLDGGHIVYATLGRWATPISLLTVLAAVAMTLFSASWAFITVMMLLMLFALGPRHPPVVYPEDRLGPRRIAVAVFALVMFLVCFTPAPIEPLELIPAGQTQSASR